MIVTKHKPKAAELKNGTHQVKINSISETRLSRDECLIIKFSNNSGSKSLSLEPSELTIKILNGILFYAQIETFSSYSQLINKPLTIEIINGKIKYITK